MSASVQAGSSGAIPKFLITHAHGLSSASSNLRYAHTTSHNTAIHMVEALKNSARVLICETLLSNVYGYADLSS